MEFDRLPSKPVIKSLTGAQAEWENWLSQNKFEFIRDGDGIDWQVAMSFEQFPSEIDRHKGKWIVTVQLGIDLPMEKLIESGSIDPDHDGRLIFLAGTGRIPLRMKKLRYEAQSESEMRDTLVRVLPELRENFRKTSLHSIKRSLVSRWVDGLSTFGQKESLGVEFGLSEVNSAIHDTET